MDRKPSQRESEQNRVREVAYRLGYHHGLSQYSTAEKRFGMKGSHCLLERETEHTPLRHFSEVVMPGRRSTVIIQMDDVTRVALQRWVHRQKTPFGFARRARALLLLEQGYTYVHTAKYVGLAEHHIRKWAKRFCEDGISGYSPVKDLTTQGVPSHSGIVPNSRVG